MTRVFVHGNPETNAIWGPLVDELRSRGIDDVVTLSPPGFGAPVPDGFGATRAEYASWLARELAAIGGDIDLVGHDWGAGHVYGALAAHDVRVRTWAADCAGLLHPDYVWHDAALAWQTPDLGEAAVQAMVEVDADTFSAMFTPLGMGDVVARRVKQGVDAEMARCILALYRDAAQPAMVGVGASFVSRRPANGLVIIAENDHYAGPESHHTWLAGAVGADVARLSGVGHWWMCENPAAGADMLVAHWSKMP